MISISAYAQRNAKEDLVRRESDWFLEIKVAQIAGKEPEDESEKKSCNLFRWTFRNLHRLGKRALSEHLLSLWASIYCSWRYVFFSKKPWKAVHILQLVETIFFLERENRKCDNVDLSYKNIDNLLKVTPESWLSSTYKFALEKCSQWLEWWQNQACQKSYGSRPHAKFGEAKLYKPCHVWSQPCNVLNSTE